jgi:hypothetical protein
LDDTLVGVGRLEVPNKEAVAAGDGNIVVQSLEHHLLHVKDLVAGVGTVADVDQIAQFRWVNLLVLGGNEEARDANELQLVTLNLLDRQVTVDEIDREVEGLRNELEFEMDLNQPVNEDGTHALIDVRLILHVNGAGRGDILLATEVIVLQEESGGGKVSGREARLTIGRNKHVCTRPLLMLLATYHFLDVIGGAERIVLVTLVNVVHLARVLVALEVGDRREGGGSRRGGDEEVGGGSRRRRRRRRTLLELGLEGDAGDVVVAIASGTRVPVGVALGHGSGLALVKGERVLTLAGIGVLAKVGVRAEVGAKGTASIPRTRKILKVIHARLL